MAYNLYSVNFANKNEILKKVLYRKYDLLIKNDDIFSARLNVFEYE